MNNEVPNYAFPERAVAAFNAMLEYADWRNMPSADAEDTSRWIRPWSPPPSPKPAPKAAII